jgi:glycosyltransferase involved in cell wall biosynthesis
MYDHVDEIVCLDAGSTDNTVKILKKYNKVKCYVIPQPDTGRCGLGWNEGDRRNLLEDSAKSEWVLVLGCDELLDDTVWSHLDSMLNNDIVVGWGFYRINYYYNFEYHKPIHQPPNGGEVRIYRRNLGMEWEDNRNDHVFVKYEGRRLYDHPKVVNTKWLIHHMHRISLRGHQAVHDRRNQNSQKVTEEYVKTQGFHKTADNKYVKPIQLPSILYEKGIVK